VIVIINRTVQYPHPNKQRNRLLLYPLHRNWGEEGGRTSNEPFVSPHPPFFPCSNGGRRGFRSLILFLRALLLQDEEFGVDGAAAGAVEPVGEAEGEEGAEEEGEDDGVVGGHVVHFCGFWVREDGERCWRWRSFKYQGRLTCECG
jgi:hypothetical protein